MSSRQSHSTKRLDWTHVVIAIISALSTILVAWLTVQGNLATIRQELQLTAIALQNQANQPTTLALNQPITVTQLVEVTHTQLVTITQLVEVTPTPDPNILRLDTISARSFAFTGSSEPLLQEKAQGHLAVNHIDADTKEYVLDYSLSDEGFMWAGYATVYEEPVDFSPYSLLELIIRKSDGSAGFQIKMVDGTGDIVYLDVHNSPGGDTGIHIEAQAGAQRITVPLRGPFDGVNREQVKELSFIINSDLGTGDHRLTVSNVRLIK
jgi:hypothetical protein